MKGRRKVFLTPAISVPRPEPTPEEKAALRQELLDNARERIIDSAERAIETMEQFLQNARRRIADVKADPMAKDFTGEYRFLQLPEHLVHELGWGNANATGSVQNAICAAHDFLRLERGPR